MTRRRARGGFTLVELLVVIGIISVLIGLLLPALQKSRNQANSVRCKAQMNQMWTMMISYMNDNKGWLFPVGPDKASGIPSTLGTNVAPWDRWPMVAFKYPHPAIPPVGTPWEVDLPYADSAPWTPPYMVCPTDFEPIAAHSYVLNQHLGDKRIRFWTKSTSKPSSDIIVMGEKQTLQGDYYMETAEFYKVVEKYRHGTKLGSNYLFKDGHVDIVPPEQAFGALDPWD